MGLTAQFAVGAHLARHARDFGGKGTELIDHRVDGFLELENLAVDIDGDFLGEIAVGHCDGYLGNVADLVGQVAGHRVDVVGQIFPCASHARHLRLTPQLAFGPHLARHAGDLRRKDAQLADHGVDEFRAAQELALKRPAFHLERHVPRKISFGDRAHRPRDLRGRPDQIGDQRVDGIFD